MINQVTCIVCKDKAPSFDMEKTSYGYVCSNACSHSLNCDLADRANDRAQALLECGPDDHIDDGECYKHTSAEDAMMNDPDDTDDLPF